MREEIESRAEGRPLSLDGAFNIRDVGGVPARGGWVRRRRLYRSDSLDQLSPSDAAALSGLGIRTIIDLRAGDEVAGSAGSGALAQCRRIAVPLAYEPWDGALLKATASAASYIADRYGDIARDGEATIARVLELLAEPDTAPVIVNCGFGKDRTGLVIAIVLGLAGVGDDDIADDFALSEAGIERMRAAVDRTGDESLRARLAQDDAFLRAPRDAIIGFLAHLRARHGSLEAYGRSLGVGQAALDRLVDSLVEARRGGAD